MTNLTQVLRNSDYCVKANRVTCYDKITQEVILQIPRNDYAVATRDENGNLIVVESDLSLGQYSNLSIKVTKAIAKITQKVSKYIIVVYYNNGLRCVVCKC